MHIIKCQVVVSAIKRSKHIKGLERERKMSLDTAVFSEGMAFRQRPKEARDQACITQGKFALAGKSSKCKDPEVGIGLTYSKMREKGSVARAR